MSFIKSILVSSLLASAAFAGNETHGGDIVLCVGKAPVVLDYFHAALPAFGEASANIEDISTWSKEKTLKYLIEKLGALHFRSDIERASAKLGSLETWIQADLKEVDDSNEPYFLPAGCERKQGAVRQGNQIFVDPTYLSKLAPSQLGVLEFHELVFFLANKRDIKTSEGVRNLVRVLLRKDSTLLSQIRAIQILKGKSYLFEFLEGKVPSLAYQCPFTNVFFERVDPETRMLQASFSNTSNIVINFPPAVLECDTSGVRCVVTKPSGPPNSAFTVKGEVLEIVEGGRIIKFPNLNLGNDCFRFSADKDPINARRDR